MAWTAADFQTYQYSYPITVVSQSARQVGVAGHILAMLATGDVAAIVGGANAGTYPVQAVSYSPDVTTVTLSYSLASAVVAGNLVLGPNDRTRLARLDTHIAEVSAAISEAVSSDGTSINTDTLQRYLETLHMERQRLAGATRGKLTRGRLVFQ